MSMLGNQPKENQKVFGRTSTVTAMQCVRQTRKKVAVKIINPRIAKIHFHLIRHWFGKWNATKDPTWTTSEGYWDTKAF
jgi:hypothetical protein